MTTDIDRQIAEKVMGWKYYYKKNGYSDPEYRDAKNIFVADVYGWHPTSNIEQAMMVLERMIELGYGDCSLIRMYKTEEWVVGFYKNEDGLGWVGSYTRGKSLPVVICEAALKAVESVESIGD